MCKMRTEIVIMVPHILKLNARSLIANGQEFKKYIHESHIVPGVICVQETWLQPHLDFRIPGFRSIRHDRSSNQNGGGCATFLKDGLAYRGLPNLGDVECNIVQNCSQRQEGNIKLINLYNPRRILVCSRKWEGRQVERKYGVETLMRIIANGVAVTQMPMWRG